MRAGSRLPLVKALADQLGLEQLAHIEAAAVRHRAVPPRLMARLIRDETDQHITPRQRQILVLLCSGFRRQEIADELGITVETVKSHISHAYQVTGAHNQIQLINAFLEDEA